MPYRQRSVQNRVVAESVAGNFDGNVNGQERLAFHYLYKQRGDDIYYIVPSPITAALETWMYGSKSYSYAQHHKLKEICLENRQISFFMVNYRQGRQWSHHM